MDKKEGIVFFDELGFGWLLDADVLKTIREKQSTDQMLIQQSLAELFGKLKPL